MATVVCKYIFVKVHTFARVNINQIDDKMEFCEEEDNNNDLTSWRYVLLFCQNDVSGNILTLKCFDVKMLTNNVSFMPQE